MFDVIVLLPSGKTEFHGSLDSHQMNNLVETCESAGFDYTVVDHTLYPLEREADESYFATINAEENGGDIPF